MKHVPVASYRRAFNAYLRTGAPIREVFLGTSDPAEVGELLRRVTDFGGRSYVVTDFWQTEFEAEAFLDARLSRYK